MAQSGYTPIQLYYSTTAAAVPVNTNLASGELAINITDGKLYYKNNSGVVTLLAGATSGPAGGSNTQVQYNSSGALAGSANLTFSGTTLTLQNGYYEAYDPADTTSAGYGMRFYTNGGGTKTENGRLVVAQSGTGSALSSMIFQTNNGTSLSEQMRLTSTGLAIGTTSATAKLTVINTADANKQIVFGDSATYYGSVGHNSGTGLNEYRTEPSGGHGFFIGTSGTANMTLNSSGNLGIGTSSPDVFSNGFAKNLGVAVTGSGATASINVSGGSGGAGRVQFGTEANRYGLIYVDASNFMQIGTTTSLPISFITNNTERARISSAGGFSVGTTADPGAGAIYATGNITAYYSDARLKTVSGKIENALDKVAQLSGVYYTNNSVAKSFGYDSDEVQVGVLAQDVEAVLPQIVKAAPFDLDENGNSKSGENYKTVQYERLVPLLIEAINELQAKVKLLENK